MVVCDSCGADVDPGSRFCGECGALVNSSVPAEAEGRGKAKSGAPRRRDRDNRRAPFVGRTERGVAEANEATKELRTTLKGVPGAPAGPARQDTKEGLPAVFRSPPGQKGATKPEAPGPARDAADGKPPLARAEFQRLLDEVESGFDAILVTTGPETIPAPPPNAATSSAPPEESENKTSENAFDEGQARQLFNDLVVANAQSIRDFMIEVRLGEPHAAWVAFCEPSVRAILRSAQGMGYTELAAKVERFIASLEASRAAPDAVIRGEAREHIIDGYSDLIAFFPEAFALEEESNRREKAIVRGLLSKVPGLHTLALERIYGTGLASLGLFYVSRPKEIAELAGVSLEIAERILERFREYRKQVSETSPEKGRRVERERVRVATEELARAVSAYERSAPVSPERRVHRRERQLALSDLTIALARLGALSELARLDALSFSARLELLRQYLDEAERRALAEQATR